VYKHRSIIIAPLLSGVIITIGAKASPLMVRGMGGVTLAPITPSLKRVERRWSHES